MTKNSFHIKSEWYRNPEISVCTMQCLKYEHSSSKWSKFNFCQNWCKIFNFRETWVKKYSYFPESLRLEMLEESRKMFTFGYDSYMKYAFPKDELDPIHCTGMIFKLHSVKIQQFSCWWDFTWNRFQHCDMWRLQHFSVSQILREINFEEFKKCWNWCIWQC